MTVIHFQEAPKQRYRRAEALYDCEADHDDELSFVEGDIIIMKHEAEADWWVSESMTIYILRSKTSG